MRRRACVAILAALFTFLAFPCFAFQNEPDGFRGIKWEEGISRRKDMVLLWKQRDGVAALPDDELPPDSHRPVNAPGVWREFSTATSYFLGPELNKTSPLRI